MSAPVRNVVALPRRRFLRLAAGAAMLPALARGAQAQAFPSRPVTMIVPFPAGGPADTVGRVMAEGMRGSLGQSVIVENVGGASGSIGVNRLARAAPDGYTFGHSGLPTHVLNGAIFNLPYDLRNDFQPIGLISNAPLLIVGRKSLPAANLSELIAWLKANPDKASQGTGGVGATSHIAGAFFQQVSGTRFGLVPYRGAGPAMQDLVSGQIDLMIDPASNTLPQVRAGNIKAYAVTSKARLPAAPDIPSVDEAGLPGFHILNWAAFFAPRGVPAPIVARLNAAVVDALADRAVRARMFELGQEIFPRAEQTPEALAAWHRAEVEKWWPIIKAAGLKGE